MADVTPEELSRLQTQFNEVLAEKDAELFDRSETVYASLKGDAELWRVWPELSPDKIPDACDYLNLVTSVNNTVPLKYVDDPMAGREIFKGRWRQAYLRRVTQGDVTKLVQVLRKGYAEEIKWDEARIKSARRLQDQPDNDPDGDDNTSANEKYMEVVWLNCSISKLDAMASSLSDSTYLDPIIENETRDGTWSNAVVATGKADDGSGTITMMLAIPHFRLDGFTTWLTHRTEKVAWLWGWEKDQAQAIANAWKAKGRSCTFGYNSSNGLVDIILRERDYDETTISSATSEWNCRYKTLADYHFGVEDPELYPIETTPADGISYERRLVDNGDGSYDIIVYTKNSQYRNVEYQTSEISADATVATRQQLGWRSVALDGAQESMVSENGVIRQQRVNVRDDCAKDITTDKDTGAVKESFVRTASPAGTSTTTIKTVQGSALGAPSSAKGHIKRNDDEASKYPGKFNTSERDEEPDNQTATSTDTSKASVNTKVLNTENDTPLTPESATKGTINRQNSTPTEAGNNRTVEEAEVPTNQTTTSTDTSKARVNTKVLNTENDTPLTPESATKGTINRQSSTPTEAGNDRTVEEVELPTNQTSTSTDTSKAGVNTKVLNTENDTPLEPEDATKGIINRQSSTPTEAGNDRTVEEAIVPTDQSAVSVDNSPSGVNTKTLHTENDTDLEAPEVANGTINRQTAAPTEAGNQRTVEEVDIPTNQTKTGESHSEAMDATEKVDTEMPADAWDTLDKTAVEKTIRDISVAPTEAGNVSVRDRVTTPKDMTIVEKVESLAETVDRTIHTEASEGIDDAAEETGKINKTVNQETPAGNVRTTAETVTPKNRIATEKLETAGRSTAVDVNTEAEDELDAPAQEDGKIKRSVSSETNVGKYHTSESVEEPHDQESDSYVKNATESVVTHLHTEGDGEEEPTPGDGEIKEANNIPTEAGKKRSVLRTRTAADQTSTDFVLTALQEAESDLNTAGPALETEVLGDGTTVEIFNRPGPYKDKYRTVRRVTTGQYVNTVVTYDDRFGTAYFSYGRNATAAEYASAVSAASLSTSTFNRITKTPSQFKSLYDFTITKRPYQASSITTFKGTLGDYSNTLYDYEQLTGSSYDVGYKWRKITITVRDYSTNFNALAACWGVLTGGDADSVRPRFLGMSAGASAYRCIKINRSYGAWSDGTTIES